MCEPSSDSEVFQQAQHSDACLPYCSVPCSCLQEPNIFREPEEANLSDPSWLHRRDQSCEHLNMLLWSPRRLLADNGALLTRSSNAGVAMLFSCGTCSLLMRQLSGTVCPSRVSPTHLRRGPANAPSILSPSFLFHTSASSPE